MNDRRLGIFGSDVLSILAMSSKQDEEEVILNCVAIFYEEGMGGENFIGRKINSAARWRKASSISSTCVAKSFLLSLKRNDLATTYTVIGLFQKKSTPPPTDGTLEILAGRGVEGSGNLGRRGGLDLKKSSSGVIFTLIC